MANAVQIRSKDFPTQGKAIDYFMLKCEEVKASGPITTGEYFEELRDLYTRYCESTNWDLNGREITAFSVDYEPRKNRQIWSSHLCYWVHFSAKQALAFSVEKAVKAIVKTSAEAGQ